MKGDFTRSTFDSTKHFTRVLMQQGRLQTDADWNEFQDIVNYLDETARTDIIGHCGFPEGEAGFGLTVRPNGELEIGAGRGYVDGVLCENESTILISDQVDLPGHVFPTEAGTYVAYLDVWQRHITALEDPEIKDVALVGPDTATRLQTVWQVKLERVADLNLDNPPTCADFGPDWQPSDTEGSSRLRARAEPDPQDSRPCIVSAQAGYRRLENQLYRVEIHQGGTAADATFKWSRDNGHIVSAWTGPDDPNTDILTVSSIGRDAVMQFAPNQWVELSDDRRELNGIPGTLVQLDRAEDQQLEIDGVATRSEFSLNPKVRRWDHQATITQADDEGGSTSPLDLVDGALPIREGVWIVLEDGVQVWFQPDGIYHTGDYWLIPARTIGADVLWPQDDDVPALEPPHGIHHHYCTLALLFRDGNGWLENQEVDCRPLFPPLINLNDIQSCGEIVVRPSDDLQAVIDRVPPGGNAKLCLHPGTWTLGTTVNVVNKGNLVFSGAGTATQIIGPSIDRCLLFSDCSSITMHNLRIEGGNAGGVGNDLRGSLSFLNCARVTLEHLQVSCNTFPTRRISAIQILTDSSQQLVDVHIHQCQLSVGHAQNGILVVNGGRVDIADNHIETPSGTFDLVQAVSDSLVAAIAGRTFLNRIVVGEDLLDDAAREVWERGDFGLGDPVEDIPTSIDALEQRRMIAQVGGWGPHPFTFSTHMNLSTRVWTDILEANPVFSSSNRNISPGVVSTRLRQLRVRLIRQLLGSDSATQPLNLTSLSRSSLDEVTRLVEANSSVLTGSQGIVIAGYRTPRFGTAEPANGLFMIDGDFAPTATVKNNYIIGFSEGIHIGTSNRSSRNLRSYHLNITGNVIHLRVTALALERHGIFVGNAHTVHVRENLVQVVFPNPRDWTIRQAPNNYQVSIAPADGIKLKGIYGPLLQIMHNHCVGVTLGISVDARNAGGHASVVGVVPAWSVTDNAYGGIGQAQSLVSEPIPRF